MQPVFRAAFTLDVSTWQPGCAHPTLRLQAFVCLSPLPRPPASPPGQPVPSLVSQVVPMLLPPKVVGSDGLESQASTPSRTAARVERCGSNSHSSG